MLQRPFSEPKRPVFYDPSQRRAIRLTVISTVITVPLVVAAIFFVGNILASPATTYAALKWSVAPRPDDAGAIEKAEESPPTARLPDGPASADNWTSSDLASEQLLSAPSPDAPTTTSDGKVEANPPADAPTGERGPDKPGLPSGPQPMSSIERNEDYTSSISTSKDAKPLSIGFYTSGDEHSYASLKKALPMLDWVVPDRFFFEGPEMSLKVAPDTKSLELIRQEAPQIAIVPMIQNATGGKWNGEGLARLLADPIARKSRIAEILTFLESESAQGLAVDFEALPADAHSYLRAFLLEMREAFRQRGLLLVVTAPLDDADWNYPALGRIADYVVLMAYDQHYADGQKGPIASQKWFVDGVRRRLSELVPERTIIAIGNYGYHWSETGRAEDLTFRQAVLHAQDNRANIQFDAQSLNPYFSYMDGQGKNHLVWFLDAITAYNQMHAADAFRPAGYALWRLGSEDPSIWPVLDHRYNSPAPLSLKTLDAEEENAVLGDGEILHITEERKSGARGLTMDRDEAFIVSENYAQLPTPLVIRRTGAQPGKVALTFDDGPDAKWTPKILDILKEKRAPATFFIVGMNGARNPWLLKRMIAEGHEIGNHTFTHPNLATVPPTVAQVELNATQRLVESLTGRSMRLFRPPYFGDSEASTADELVAVQEAEKLGYITVGLRVDPHDWANPLADQIVSRVMAQVADPDPETRGQIVLLHDSGGDRSQTVAAMPKLIDRLRAEKFSIVPVSELAGWTLDEVMPPIPNEGYIPALNRAVFLTMNYVLKALYWLCALAIGLGLGRLVILCLLACFGRRRAAAPNITFREPMVSVIIPAYNEGLVIVAAIQRILQSHYPHIEVIIIDDGSTDGTADLVYDHFADDPRVTIMSIPNSGKATAVNTGLSFAIGEVIVALDADTQFEPDAIAKLTRWFVDPKVGAVAGNAKVGNRINTVTRWQALEYVTAQNLERRALAVLGCVTVVPGAVGAWRRDMLRKLGGFPSDTLAEDQDLTMAVQKAGYTALFDPEAIAWTEAPQTVPGLVKQRFRWAFGTLQCVWKHRDACLKARFGSLGIVGIPQIWLFQILLSLVAPLIDLMLISQILGCGLDYLQHGEQYDSSSLRLACIYYAVFVAVDFAAAVIAFLFEKKESWRLLLWLPLQRFGYRQLMYYVVLKSVWAAAKGRFVGWSKLQRTGTVASADRENAVPLNAAMMQFDAPS